MKGRSPSTCKTRGSSNDGAERESDRCRPDGREWACLVVSSARHRRRWSSAVHLAGDQPGDGLREGARVRGHRTAGALMHDHSVPPEDSRLRVGSLSPDTAAWTWPSSTSSTPRPSDSPRSTNPSPASSPTTGPTRQTLATSPRSTGTMCRRWTSSAAAFLVRTCRRWASRPVLHLAHAPACGRTWPRRSKCCNRSTW